MSLRAQGTTLVELLIAITLVGIFSGVLMTSIGAGNMKVDRARQRVVALSKAREEIEGRRAVAREGSLTPGTTTQAIARSGGVGPFDITRTITEITTGGIQRLYNVHVLVTWKTNEGSTDRIELELWIRDDDE